nr:MAG TPA: hypothetical protein [Bacteriophage sp.]
MIEKNKKLIDDFCLTASLLGMDKDEVIKRLVGTEAVRDSDWNEVKEIIDSWF